MISTSSSSSAARARSLYRALLRAARSLPLKQDRESLEQEAKQRFRGEKERAEKREKSEKSSEKSNGGDSCEKSNESAAALLSSLFDEAEARLYDARHHGIPFARLEHAPQIPRAVLESAKKLQSEGGEGGKEREISLPRDKGARAKLEAALERRRLKKKREEEG
jgi:hypothetical protein